MKTKKILLGLLALTFIIQGCSNIRPSKLKKQIQFNKSENSIREVENKKKSPSKVDRKPIPQVAYNLEDVLKIYLNETFDDSSIEDINIERLRVELIGDPITFEIDGFRDGKEYKLRIRDNGEIIDEKIDDCIGKKYAIDFKKIISGKDAMEKALEGKNKDRRIKGYELRIENARAVYYIDIADGKDIKINAASGEIIK